MRFITEYPRVKSWLAGGVAGLVLVILLVAIGSLLASATSDTEEDLSADQRIVTVYDNGERKTIVTKSRSVDEALKQADIEVDTYDIVEPALDASFDTTDYTVNIYRARPILVDDGMQREWVMTPALSAREIASEAALEDELRTEDIVYFSDNTETAVDGISALVSIDRAAAVDIVLYGEQVRLYTQADTIKELLKEKDIKLGENDTITVDLEADISEVASFQVWREGVQTVTQEEDVEFPVRTIRDADKEVGFREVQSAGEPGKRTVTYEVNMRDGQEVSREEIQSVITKEPVEEVVTVGTKPKTMLYTGGGSKSEWLAASNIPEDQWGYADWLVSRESGWNPNAVNRSSGACGLAQAYPCGKVPGNPHDPVNSLNWMNSYVNGRYGSWAGAVAHSQSTGWY